MVSDLSNPGAEDVPALCQAAAGGDTDAAERLLWLHHNRLMGLARRKIGVDWQGKLEPEDILQEAYIDILRTINGFEARDSESYFHWAARIVEHKFIDQVRRLRRKKRDVAREVSSGGDGDSGHDSLLDECLPEQSTPSQVMRRQDATAALMACLAKLPDEPREVVARHYLRGETFGVIASELGRSEDAVRRQCSRAVEKLRDCLGRASRYLSNA